MKITVRGSVMNGKVFNDENSAMQLYNLAIAGDVAILRNGFVFDVHIVGDNIELWWLVSDYVH